MTDTSSEKSGWKRMSFKGNKVWVRTDADGNPDLANGKALIKYNLNQDYEYRVHESALKPEDQAVPAGSKSSKKKKTGAGHSRIDPSVPENCIKIYTDGASSGNPGPAGIGVFLIYGENQKKISEYIGEATNNIAELTAIKKALTSLKRFDLPVRIFSDSNYAIGSLTKPWKSKKNRELILEIKQLMNRFDDLALIKVKGHSGIRENEVADFLATSAIKKA
jgi:ribonuclease HI